MFEEAGEDELRQPGVDAEVKRQGSARTRPIKASTQPMLSAALLSDRDRGTGGGHYRHEDRRSGS